MTTTEIIDGKEVIIDWNDIHEITDTHDSGSEDASLLGDGDDGKTYIGSGYLQDGEIIGLHDDADIEEWTK